MLLLLGTLSRLMSVGGREMLFSRLKGVLILMIACHFSPSVRTQMLGCNFQEVNLVSCLSQPIAGNMTEFCCTALNMALNAGYRCVCSVLASTNLLLVASVNPLLTPPLLLPLPGCLLSSPSLAACQGPLQQLYSSPTADNKPLLPPIASPPPPNSTRTRKCHLGKEVPESGNDNTPMTSFGTRGVNSGGRRKTGSMPLIAFLVSAIFVGIM